VKERRSYGKKKNFQKDANSESFEIKEGPEEKKEAVHSLHLKGIA